MPAPLCPFFGRCGGCFYQDIPYDEELRRKERGLHEMFQAHFKDWDEIIFEPIVPSPKPYHYRNRLDLQARRLPGGKITLGFTPVEGRGVLPVDSCSIAREEISEFIPKLHRQLEDGWPEKYRRANLVVRSGEEGKVRWGGIGRGSLRLDEKDYFWAEVAGRRIFYTLDTFFQANLSILPAVVEKIKELDVLRPESVFFDLYGGVGLFGLTLYDNVKKVVLIEDNVHAVKLAKFNAAFHKLVSFETHSGRVEDLLEDIVKAEPIAEKIAMIDPPRGGLSHAATRAMSRRKEFRFLLYLSCHPESLVRDLKDFTVEGWKITKVIPFDFFPKTKHIETLAVLKNERR
jgi:tRNA/tmRNA/rRNA uracil-C5-methylase (TrmA/RlmC/RlmD family)